jgi:hypothetical protein
LVLFFSNSEFNSSKEAVNLSTAAYFAVTTEVAEFTDS